MSAPNKPAFYPQAGTRGWRVPAAPECPNWSAQEYAWIYANKRNHGASHIDAWNETEVYRKEQECGGGKKTQ